VQPQLNRAIKWLYPGLGVKRWLFTAAVGLVTFTLSFVLFVSWRVDKWFGLNLTGEIHAWGRSAGYPSFISLGLMVAGIFLMYAGIHRWFDSIYDVIVPHESRRIVDVIYENRALSHRFKIVAIGGGTGLASLLRGLKAYTANITAVVTVSDDGGSSGRLRKERGLLPPGDIRNCLVALADQDTLLSELFQYRFREGGDLAGHSFGNLFLAALTEVAEGDFDRAIKLSSSILAIRGRVVPGTLRQTVLCAEFADGTQVEGESTIPAVGKPITRLWLNPGDCEPLPEVLAAIREADAIILGPGSLYTSVLPNLLVPGMVEALRDAPGLRMYVCNCMTQPGETDGFKASDHLQALLRHTAPGIVDVALVNDTPPQRALDRYQAEGAYPVPPDVEAIRALGVRPVLAHLIHETDLVRHDSERLAEVISKTIMEHTEGRDYSKRGSKEERFAPLTPYKPSSSG
jgi:uncharacterized cofD-like protein